MSRGTTTVSGDIKVEKSKMKWDPKTLEIRTHSVEKTLEPLVHQVSLFILFVSGIYWKIEDRFNAISAFVLRKDVLYSY